MALLRASLKLQNLVLLACIAALWAAFGPVNLGGQTAFVLVNGTSMQPLFYRGDLVLVRRSSSYRVGDIITFRDGDLGSQVIHRIIGEAQGRFITQGDNNAWIDEYHPQSGDIIGKYWILLPKAGRVVEWIRKPLQLALLVGIVGGLVMFLNMTQTTTKNGKKKAAAGGPSSLLEMGLYVLAFFGLAFLGLTIFAFTRPLTRASDPIKYQQMGNFFYTADGTPDVYDTGSVQSGEPVFTQLTCSLNVGFVYYLAGEQLENIAGTQQILATVIDTRTGWRRSLPLTGTTSFTGHTFTTTAALDLCQVGSLLQTVKDETGYALTADTLRISANVAVAGKLAGHIFSDSFQPSVTLKFDALHFSLSQNNSETDPLHTEKEGSIADPGIVANTVGLLGWEMDVRSLRTAAAVGLGCALAGLAVAGFFVYRASRAQPHMLIQLQYGSLVVDVRDTDPEPRAQMVDVLTFASLVKMAERHNTVILHYACSGGHFYLVRADGYTYRFYQKTVPEVAVLPDAEFAAAD